MFPVLMIPVLIRFMILSKSLQFILWKRVVLPCNCPSVALMNTLQGRSAKNYLQNWCNKQKDGLTQRLIESRHAIKKRKKNRKLFIFCFLRVVNHFRMSKPKVWMRFWLNEAVNLLPQNARSWEAAVKSLRAMHLLWPMEGQIICLSIFLSFTRWTSKS